MRNMIAEYQKLKQAGDRKVDLLLKRIRIKHPIFHMMTNSAFKFIMEQSVLFKVKPGQTIYKEFALAKPNVYLVLYGELELSSSKM